MGETDDYRSEEESDVSSPLYSEGVKVAKESCARILHRKLSEYPDTLRSYAFLRQDLLNPNARQLWLAHWTGGRKVSPMTAYAIPRIPYRTDIPTPSERYSRDTVVEQWPAWKDTEDTALIGGRKVPVVRYPHDGESDAPAVFSNGKGAMEYGWEKTEHDFLGKAGVPIMLRVFAAGKVTDVAIDLHSGTGQVQPVRIYQNGDPRVALRGDWITILAVPESHLEPGVEYTVRVSANLPGDTPLVRTWSFTTRGR